jgi:general secretion pathway protein I
MGRSHRGRRSAGFSLLELIVAVAILALSLGALYQAVGGASRNARTDERYAYAVELSNSLLANHAVVPAAGFALDGETAGGFRWEVRALPLALPESALAEGALQDIRVSVSWLDGDRRREVVLNSVVRGTFQ